jgi:uncharacterized membrane protein YagU involved in acid resistance
MTASGSTSTDRPWAAILVGGVIAGVLDICSAFVAAGSRGVTPFQVLQSVASGLYGGESFAGGWRTALIGLALHFLIAFTATAIYWLASRKLRVLIERPVLCGFVYAELVYLFMNFVVLPLSAIGRVGWKLSWQHMLAGPVGHLVFVGLPIALAVRHFSARRARVA